VSIISGEKDIRDSNHPVIKNRLAALNMDSTTAKINTGSLYDQWNEFYQLLSKNITLQCRFKIPLY
jgi:hypothetical protein